MSKGDVFDVDAVLGYIAPNLNSAIRKREKDHDSSDSSQESEDLVSTDTSQQSSVDSIYT
jgi:hypothetical protein